MRIRVLWMVAAGLGAWVNPVSAQQVKAPGGFVPQAAIAYGGAGMPAVAVDADTPLPVAPRPVAVAYFDRSGTIATAGTAQPVAAARAARRGFMLQNLSSGDLWIGLGTAAAAGAGAIRVGAGQMYESPAAGVPAGAISVVGAAAGQAFTAKEW